MSLKKIEKISKSSGSRKACEDSNILIFTNTQFIINFEKEKLKEILSTNETLLTAQTRHEFEKTHEA